MQVQAINNKPNFGKVTVVAVRKNIFKSPQDAKACYNEFQQAFQAVTQKKPANLVNLLYGANDKLSDTVILPSKMSDNNIIIRPGYLSLEKDYHLFLVCTGKAKNNLKENLDLKNRLRWIKENDGNMDTFRKHAVSEIRWQLLCGWDGYMLKDWARFSNIVQSLE